MAWKSLNKSKQSKYHAEKTIIDGERFDSKREAERWQELRLMEKAGLIQNLQRQVKYELIPPYKDGKKTILRGCSYIADFQYEENGRLVVEDSKGMQTPEYKIKKKLMAWLNGIVIRET